MYDSDNFSVSTKCHKIAVASKSGVIVDQHFGHATRFLIYEYTNGKAFFKQERTVPQYCTGSSEYDDDKDKMQAFLQTISDCDCVLSMRIGVIPEIMLNQMGIRSYMTYDRIEDAIQEVYALKNE